MRSYRGFLFATLCLTFPLPASAGLVHYGVRAGTNLATITGDFADIADPKTKVGFTGGGFVSLSPAPRVGIELDLLYVEKGFKIEGTATDQSGNVVGTTEAFLKLQYLDVPLMANVSLPRMGMVSPYVIAGPNLGIGLSAKEEATFPGVPTESDDLTSDLQKLDWGATGGVGLRLGSGPVSFGLEARFERSFSDLWDIQGNRESINQGWMITAWASR